ncbi:MAG TPA: DUF5131 family protein, partial [Armatimonadota bacterium]|nr:DUF5131 family protein [Armatimonadota bacterium]
SLRDQCTAAGVTFFFKQWGEWTPHAFPGPDHSEDARLFTLVGPARWDGRTSRDGDVTRHLHGNEWMASMARVGRRRAGRELDGRTWDEFPQPSLTPRETPHEHCC